MLVYQRVTWSVTLSTCKGNLTTVAAACFIHDLWLKKESATSWNSSKIPRLLIHLITEWHWRLWPLHCQWRCCPPSHHQRMPTTVACKKTTESRRPRPSDCSHRMGLLNVPLKRILSERTAQLMIISSENILATNKWRMKSTKQLNSQRVPKLASLELPFDSPKTNPPRQQRILYDIISIYQHISRYLQIVIPGYPRMTPKAAELLSKAFKCLLTSAIQSWRGQSHCTSSQRLQPRGSASLRSQPNVEPRRPLPVASRCTWPWGWDAPKKVEVTIGHRQHVVHPSDSIRRAKIQTDLVSGHIWV